MIAEKNKYLIICKKHMRSNDPAIWFWGPNSSGYTSDIDQAGIYEEEEVEFTRGHESDDSPKSLEIIVPLIKWAVYEGRRLIQYVPNTAENRKILGISNKELLPRVTPPNFSSYEGLQDYLDRNKNVMFLMNEIGSLLKKDIEAETLDDKKYPVWDVCTQYRKGDHVIINGSLNIIPSDEVGVKPIPVPEYIKQESLVPVDAERKKYNILPKGLNGKRLIVKI